MLAVAGLTVTDATGTGTAATAIAEVPPRPSLVAVIVALPAATLVTSPLAETVTTPAALLDQLTARPVRRLLAESNVDALSCSVPPGASAPVAGLTTIEATGTTDSAMADVSAREPPFWLAMTRYVPAVCPAEYQPPPETAPPVAE